MKKSVIIMALVSVLFVGCASSPKTKYVNGVEVPEWLLKEPTSEDGIYATGAASIAKKGDKSENIAVAIEVAETVARANLSQKMNSNVTDSIRTSNNLNPGSRKYDRSSTQTSSSMLKYATRADTFVDKNSVHVLLYLPTNR